MKFIINIETNEPMDIKRIADALTGTTATVTTGNDKASAKTSGAKQDTATSTAQTSAVAGQTATTAASPSEAANIPSEKQITEAANGAVAKLGAGGQIKIKEFIGKTFQQKDGSPAGLRSVRDEQKADLVAKLNQIAAGALAV